MTFPQFAFKNITRNSRSYFAFYLSSSFAVMIFYMFAMFIFHPGLDTGYINSAVKKAMTYAEFIIFGFSIFFILYSASAFLKTRKKEFGILTIQGASRKQLRLLITCENVIIGLASILTGIICGTILAKLFFTAGTYIVEMEPLKLYLPWKAFALTAGVFVVLFFWISTFTIRIIRSEEIIALLKGSDKPKKEPKTSVLFTILCILFLGIAFGMAPLGVKIDSNNAMIMLVFTVIGTYLFYSQLSVWILKLFKRNKRYYRKGTNLLWISDLMYHVRDNSRLFFIVSIVSTVAFTATSSLALLSSVFPSNEIHYEMELISSPSNEKEQEQVRYIQQQLDEQKIKYVQYEMEALNIQEYEIREFTAYNLLVLPYEEVALSLPDIQKLTLKDGEGILLGTFTGPDNGKLQIELRKQNMNIAIQTFEEPISMLREVLVVGKRDFEKLKQNIGVNTFYGFNIPNWKDTLDISDKINSHVVGGLYNPDVEYSSKAQIYFEQVQVPSLSLFIGLFVAIIFVLAAGSFLYFRLYTDLYEDRKKYKSLAKIGLSEKEMVKNATIQIAILFFLPFLMAIISTGFAIYALQQDGGFEKVFQTTSLTISGFVVLQFLYFIIIRTSYIKNLKDYVYR